MSRSTRKPKSTVPSMFVVLAGYYALTGQHATTKQGFAELHQYNSDVMGSERLNSLYARARAVQLQWGEMSYSEVGECIRIEGYTYGCERKGL